MPYFFDGTIASLAAFATRIFTTVFAGILIASPVARLRPIRAFLFTKTSFPIPGRVNEQAFLVSEMDKNPPEFVNGRVKVHPLVRTLMKECGEGGWIAAPFPFDLGGQQLPLMISGVCRFIVSAANYSASVYPFLTTGAAHLILAFGSQMKDSFLLIEQLGFLHL